MDPRFIHLRARSAYSLLEGAIHVKKLPGLAAGLGMPAIGLADSGNLFGALEFSESAAKAGVQPIMGLTLDVLPERPKPGEKVLPPAPLVLFAQDETGWLNLMALTSAAYLETPDSAEPHVLLAAVEAHSDGLLCLTGGVEGIVAQQFSHGRAAQAEAICARLEAAFPNRLYIELQRHGANGATPEEATVEEALLGLAYDRALPLVATNAVYFESPGMFEAHDALLCIGEGR
ncbi:MAG: PHP domain-containing protein, partial [Pseudomonadota bacterium]